MVVQPILCSTYQTTSNMSSSNLARVLFIRITFPYTCTSNIRPLIPHFYIAKLGYAGVYLFLLFLLQNNKEVVLACTHNLCFEQF